VTFTFTSLTGGSVSGVALSPTSTSLLSGTVGTATGSYADLLGHAVTFDFTLTPIETSLVPIPLPVGNSYSELEPAVLLGSMKVSP